MHSKKMIFLFLNQNMLWVLKRTISMGQFFWAPKTFGQIDGSENISNIMLKIFVYLKLCIMIQVL